MSESPDSQAYQESSEVPAISLGKVSHGYFPATHHVGSAPVQPLFENFDLCVAQGEILVLLGPSGTGKTTLLNLLAGLDVPLAGEIWHRVPGQRKFNLSELSEHQRTLFRRRYVGFVFQQYNLVPTLTVMENAALCARLNKDPAGVRRAHELLVDLGLAAHLQKFPDRLSGGEQQRVAIVRALAHQPPLLIADEPTGSLDRDTAEQVMALLIEQVRALKSTLILATHHRDYGQLADQVVDLGAVSPRLRDSARAD